MKAAILLIAFALQGCAALTALMPTPTPCAPKDSPAKPQTMSNDMLRKMDDYHLILIIGEERLRLIDYAGKADAIIQACK